MAISTDSNFDEQIEALQQQPQALEDLYQQVKRLRSFDAFRAAIRRSYANHPDNQLLAAWFYRFQAESSSATAFILDSHWLSAIIVGGFLGLILWLFSDPSLKLSSIPLIAVLWAPLFAGGLLVYLALTGKRSWRWIVPTTGLLVAATAYVLIMAANGLAIMSANQPLLLLHLPLIAAGAVGLYLVGPTRRGRDVHAFIWKGIETIGVAGVYMIAGGAFVGLIVGLFLAIGITPNNTILRLLAAGGAGLIAILAAATSYQPELAPGDQDTQHGFARLIGIAAQVLLPLGLFALILYLIFLPFNFTLVFTNRNSLIIYNVLLFGAVALIVAATPLADTMLSPRLQTWARRGVVSLAALVIFISLHALAAIVYRTFQGGLTMNRFIVIGWNVINIGLLTLFLIGQARHSERDWIERAQDVYRTGACAYMIWGLLVVAGMPWLPLR